MNGFKNNIALSYLYRDGGNNKKYNAVIFTNNSSIDLEIVEQRIKAILIAGEWFDANNWRLEDLHFCEWDNELDVIWHEFDCVEETTESATQLDITNFLLHIERSTAASS